MRTMDLKQNALFVSPFPTNSFFSFSQKTIKLILEAVTKLWCMNGNQSLRPVLQGVYNRQPIISHALQPSVSKEEKHSTEHHDTQQDLVQSSCLDQLLSPA